MIVFVCTARHQYTIRDALETRRHPLEGRLVVMCHEDFIASRRLPDATYVFADNERLPASRRELVAERFRQLRAALPDIYCLNPPDAAPDRLTVLERLHRRGMNGFRAFRADAVAEDARYPVFLRAVDDHEGPMGDLLQSRAELDGAIAVAVAAGTPAARLMVTEFVDVRNQDGHYEKYGYFRVGATMFPVALDISEHWVCKGLPDEPGRVEEMERELAFLDGRVHEPALREAFDIAGITYGRADFGLADGRPQVFEINTNPMIEVPEQVSALDLPATVRQLERWVAAMVALSPEKAPARWVSVGGFAAQPRPEGMGLKRGLARRVLASVGKLEHELWLMRHGRRLGLI